MTLNDPLFQQNGNFSASEFRDVLEIIPGIGVFLDGDLKVVQRAAGALMSVDIAVGTCVIPAAVATRGKYMCRSTAVENRAITASPGTGSSRIDIVTAKVNDTEYGDATNTWSLQVVAGVAAATPVAPATPAGSILLATVAVGSGVGQIVNANITDARGYARAITSTDRLPTATTPAAGQMVVNAAGAITTYTPLFGWLKSGQYGNQFGAATAVMASTALTGAGAGFAVASIPQPSGGVNVIVSFYGTTTADTGATNSICNVNAQVSTNGGSTWTAGESVQALSVNSLSGVSIAAGHTFSVASPTGAIQGRVYANRVGSPGCLLYGHVVVHCIPN